MSGLTLTDGGLLVPEGSLEASVSRALQQHDRDLRLVPQDSARFGRRVYRVIRSNGPDRPPDFVCWWADEYGAPLPLSFSLVDYVQLHDRNTVGRPKDADELDREFRAQKRKDYLRDAEAIVHDHADRVDGKKQQVLPRSRSLYLARQRARAKQPKEFWS